MRRLNRVALGCILGNILTNAAKYFGGDLQITLDASGELRFENAAPELNEVQVGAADSAFDLLISFKRLKNIPFFIDKLFQKCYTVYIR